jgi:hypothetical protein
MPEKKVIEVYVTKKPEGPVDESKIQKGLATPPKEEVSGRTPHFWLIYCWQCGSVFVGWWDQVPSWATCPNCGAVCEF